MKTILQYGREKLSIYALLALIISAANGCMALTTPVAVETDPAKVKAGHYTIDHHHASLIFKVQHMGLAPYVGRFNHFDASIDYNPTTPQATHISASIDVASLDVNFPDFAEELKGADWFDVGNYSAITFQSRGVEWLSNSEAKVSGEMTLLGVTSPVVMSVNFIGATRHIITGAYTLGFSAQLNFKRSAFGLDKFIPVVGDDVSIEIHAEFQRQ